MNNTNEEKIINLLLSTKREGITDLIMFLRSTDFFSAPSSAKYHGNYEGGLAEHSLNVYKLLVEKNERYNLNLSPSTLIIVPILHDICKISFYKLETKWRKDSNNKWESYEGYSYDDKLPIGHGEKSVIMLQEFLQLSNQEVLMIRWHMGSFNLNYQDSMTYNNACEMCPEIVALHTSDYESCKFLERIEVK